MFKFTVSYLHSKVILRQLKLRGIKPWVLTYLITSFVLCFIRIKMSHTFFEMAMGLTFDYYDIQLMFKRNCYLSHIKPLFHKTLLHSDLKMKPSLTIFLLFAVSCNANEFVKLGKWLSKPNFDFSYLSEEEKSLCQKHLEYYTKSLTNGIPKSWALKSKSTILVPLYVITQFWWFFQCLIQLPRFQMAY